MVVVVTGHVPTAATLAFGGVLAAIAVSTHLAAGLRVLDQPVGEATAGH